MQVSPSRSSKMLTFMVFILTINGVYSSCVVPIACTDNTTFQNEIANQHNAYRRTVVPAASDMLQMSYDTDAAVSAQSWVNNCTLAHGPSSSRMLGGYEMGENLFYSNLPHNWTQVIAAWYAEVNNYKYPTGSTNGAATGHYTQVVWNSSYKVGCGVAKCPGPIYFYSCHYFRAGNFNGYAPYNAGTPCSSCPNSCVNGLCTNPCPYINKYSNCPTLKKQAGCGNVQVAAWCPAACKCTTEIIPIGK